MVREDFQEELELELRQACREDFQEELELELRQAWGLDRQKASWDRQRGPAVSRRWE